MSTSVIVPLAAGVNLYQIVFETPVTNGIWTFWAQSGTGSLVWVVAPELSFVSVNVPEFSVTVMALAKLSFVGAGATTVNVGNVTVDVVTVVPPPGGGFCTPTEFVLPKPAMKLAGTVAVSCVALTKLVVIVAPPVSGLRITSEVEPKFVPVTVMVVAAEFTGALAGVEFVIVGAWPITVKGKELLVLAPSFTFTCATAPAAKSAAEMAAVSCAALTNVVVLELPFHITAELPVKPVPLTVSVVGAPGALAEKGESLLISKAGVFGPAPRLMSHMPRPCVAARKVREGL